jgi:uncharacterized membrane protein
MMQMSGQEAAGKYRISKNRVEALVDGIYAFAMTLLVISLTVPVLSKSEAAATLATRVFAMHTEFFTFLIAFLVLASFWLVHHRHFHFVRMVNPTLVWINIYTLAFIVLMPFSTSISGDYPDIQIAVVLFHANMLIISIFFLIHWHYISHHPEIMSESLDLKDAECGIRRSLIVPVVALIGILVSFITPSYSMAAYLLIPCGMIVVHHYFCPQEMNR